MSQSENINELAMALSKCQGQMEPALKDSSNPFFKSKYADLASVWAVCRQPLFDNGLCVIQTIDKDINGDPILITTLAHGSGQWINSHAPIPIKEETGKIDPNKKSFKNDPQAIGSSITYMRRYCLCAIVGISTEDDDGEGAMNRNNKESKKIHDIIPIIGPGKVKQLSEMTEKCDPEYVVKMTNYLESIGIRDFAMMKEDMFPKIMRGMQSNADIYQKQKDTL